MARIAAAIVLVLSPCPVLRASYPAPVGTVVTSGPPSPAVSTPRPVRAQRVTAVTGRVAITTVTRTVPSSHPPRRPSRATRTSLSHRKPVRRARTATKPLTARQFAASLPRPWPAIVRCEALNDGSWKVSSDSHARGLFQFLKSSWRLVHGHGDPAAASFAEQYRRARALLRLQGWGAWECSRIVGVR